jgi:predicted O-methyltransferase YrrM
VPGVTVDGPAPRGVERQVEDVTFVYEFGQGSTADRFLIRKPPDLFDKYVELTPRLDGATIVELGIAAGGSTALMSLLARPRALIACELATTRVAALDELIAARGLSDIVRPFYGVDQGDGDGLAALVERELPGQALDLVIDDASHRYAETRTSFDVLFPRLRPGGLFLIEDWAADYAYARQIAVTLSDPTSPAAVALEQRLAQAAAEHPGGPRPLPQIGVELLHVVGAGSDVVAGLEIDRHWIAVERGPAHLDPAAFRLDDHVVDEWGWLSPRP